MFDWGLFTDYHEAIPHLAFEAMTVAVPAVFGWVLGHRRHDAKRHDDHTHHTPTHHFPFRDLRHVSELTQRIERIEARLEAE